MGSTKISPARMPPAYRTIHDRCGNMPAHLAAIKVLILSCHN